MSLLEKYEYYSGYKLNISKTQILSLNYSPSRQIREAYNLKWNSKTMKYLGVTLFSNMSGSVLLNYSEIEKNIQKDFQPPVRLQCQNTDSQNEYFT